MYQLPTTTGVECERRQLSGVEKMLFYVKDFFLEKFNSRRGPKD